MPVHLRYRVPDVSIHLMLLFIVIASTHTLKFYDVSIHLMLLFIATSFGVEAPKCSRFNTSHVTLYLLRCLRSDQQPSFQYISCYSLSMLARLEGRMITEFQYISCYSLSNRSALRKSQKTVSIHLMLLFIWKSTWSEATQTCFNTSHVTLYPSFYRLFFF